MEMMRVFAEKFFQAKSNFSRMCKTHLWVKRQNFFINKALHGTIQKQLLRGAEQEQF